MPEHVCVWKGTSAATSEYRERQVYRPPASIDAVVPFDARGMEILQKHVLSKKRIIPSDEKRKADKEPPSSSSHPSFA